MIGVRSRLAAVALATVAATTVGGCGFHGIYSLPLPGAVANGSDTYQVKIQFADVLDLLPYSACKANGATVGHVAAISLQGSHALVTCQLLDSVHLPRNAVASIQETSLLGERYVELQAPNGVGPTGRLADGDLIPLRDTQTDATVEEVLGALSALLNGGGLAQIHTIAHEVDTALSGRTAVARDLLVRLRDFATGLDAQRGQILQAIAGLDRLARTVRGQEGELTEATEVMPAALHTLTQDRSQLTGMLVALSHLGKVATRVINASQQDLISNLHALRPTLAQLADAGDAIPKTLGILITYPIGDSVQLQYKGDYGNLALTVDMSGQSLATFLKGLQLSAPSARAAAGRRTAQHSGKGQSGLSLPTKPLRKLGKPLHKLPGGKAVQQLLGSITHRAPGHTIRGLLLDNNQ